LLRDWIANTSTGVAHSVVAGVGGGANSSRWEAAALETRHTGVLKVLIGATVAIVASLGRDAGGAHANSTATATARTCAKGRVASISNDLVNVRAERLVIGEGVSATAVIAEHIHLLARRSGTIIDVDRDKILDSCVLEILNLVSNRLRISGSVHTIRKGNNDGNSIDAMVRVNVGANQPQALTDIRILLVLTHLNVSEKINLSLILSQGQLYARGDRELNDRQSCRIWSKGEALSEALHELIDLVPLIVVDRARTVE